MTPEQARALRESATNIIAHEKMLEAQRTKLYDDLERANTNARQAVMMAEEASREGDAPKAASFNDSAEVLAQHIVSIDTQIAQVDIELIEARQASEEAKSVASNSAISMAQTKAKGAELRAEFERAKLGVTAAEGVPSYDEVKDKIGERIAQAEAVAEVQEADTGADLSGATAMVEEAAAEARAKAKLAEIRSQMGVGSHDTSTPESARDEGSDTESPDGV
ncbi:MAG: PspA/IM30 family protein [Acidimicrobiales bacterium]